MTDFTRRSLLLAGGYAMGAPLPAARSKPNILFICSDQHSGLVVGANRHPVVKTPNMDRLAASGTNFRTAYCGSPVCAPGRACMMTGKYASDVGSYCNSSPFDGRVPAWSNRLRDAGYHCWATGKLDLWEHKDFGFHEVDTVHEHSTGPDITSLFRAPVCFRGDERSNADGKFADRQHPDYARTENAIGFLRDTPGKIDKPWCAYVGYTMPHPRFVAASKYAQVYPVADMPLPTWPEGYLEQRHPAFQILAQFKNVQLPIPTERVRRARAAYYGMITEMDALVGKVLDQLDRTGQRDNTLIVYTSDHGEMLGEHGLWLKNTLLENAARVPMIVSGPGIPKGKTIDTPVSHVDLVATLVDAAGAVPTGLRGQSLRPLVNGQESAAPKFAFSESHSEGNCTGSFMIRKEGFKYIYFTSGEPLLFNLASPGGEFQNLARDKRFDEVRADLHKHLTSVVDPDAVTFQAFRRQREILQQLTKTKSKPEFYKMLVGRVGSMQAAALLEQNYGSA